MPADAFLGKMDIKEFYKGFSDEQIEKYRQEACRRWGEDVIRESEDRIVRMGKAGFATVQAEGASIFETISGHMAKGFDSPEVQQQIARWRKWLENFSTYTDEAVLELGRAYSQDPRFTRVFSDINEELPRFLTKAIEHYCSCR